MTGWRCGWAIGPAPVIAACNALQSHSTSNVTSITQKAAVAALTGSQELRDARCSTSTARRRDQLHAWLTADPRIALREAGRRVLPVRRHHRRCCRRTASARPPSSPSAARRGARGADAGRGVRRARVSSASRTRRRWTSCARARTRIHAFVQTLERGRQDRRYVCQAPDCGSGDPATCWLTALRRTRRRGGRRRARPDDDADRSLTYGTDALKQRPSRRPRRRCRRTTGEVAAVARCATSTAMPLVSARRRHRLHRRRGAVRGRRRARARALESHSRDRRSTTCSRSSSRT